MGVVPYLFPDEQYLLGYPNVTISGDQDPQQDYHVVEFGGTAASVLTYGLGEIAGDYQISGLGDTGPRFVKSPDYVRSMIDVTGMRSPDIMLSRLFRDSLAAIGRMVEQNVREAVVAEFSRILQVSSVFCFRRGSGVEITVFTHGDHYDDDLMDTLLDCEYRLTDQITFPVMFRYLPSWADGSQSGAVPQSATQIFAR